jgi:hypothetical protein
MGASSRLRGFPQMFIIEKQSAVELINVINGVRMDLSFQCKEF